VCAALWTPVFTLVPILQLFPITFNRWVVIFMMAHYAVRL
jgi:hypothetical protein